MVGCVVVLDDEPEPVVPLVPEPLVDDDEVGGFVVLPDAPMPLEEGAVAEPEAVPDAEPMPEVEPEAVPVLLQAARAAAAIAASANFNMITPVVN